VRVKLDENLPAGALAVAVVLGHDADNVSSENLTGATDPDVLAAATADDRFLITWTVDSATSGPIRWDPWRDRCPAVDS
jgi:predicted nuclease of predicted toxin-antitoxin system